MRLSAQTVSETLSVLRQGGLVIAPSDTVYGLLVDATNAQAVAKLIQFKNRPFGKPISVFVKDMQMLKEQVITRPEQEALARSLLPGPFTIVLPSQHRVNQSLESERGTLGVRIPDYELISNLTRAFGKPITATSANLSGRPPHYSLESLLNELPNHKKSLIDLAIDAGKLPRNKPSTVIDLSQSDMKIMRKGDLVVKSQETFISESPSQTQKVAQYVLKKIVDQQLKKPVVILLHGDLGAGKTVFVKGIGEMLGISNIISPTYVIYYEYDIKTQNVKRKVQNLVDKFYHFDLYNIEEKSEFEHLGITQLLKAGNLLCFEWGAKAGDFLEVLQSHAKVISIELKYVNEQHREIIIRS